MSLIVEDLTPKLQALSPQQLEQVDSLVSSMLRDENEDRALVRAAFILSHRSLAEVWDNPDDDVYNEL